MGLDEDGLDDLKKTIERLVNRMPDAMKEAAQESLDEGQMHSYDIVHVVTGRLQSTIRTENVSEDGGDLVAGGTGGVNYAAVEEFGNSTREGHPYLEPGFEITKREAPNRIKEKIEDLL
jgi:HK97 gp10 family phage protein